MATTEKLLTAEEFERLPDDGKLYELIDGQLRQIPRLTMWQGEIYASHTHWQPTPERSNDGPQTMSIRQESSLHYHPSPCEPGKVDILCTARRQLLSWHPRSGKRPNDDLAMGDTSASDPSGSAFVPFLTFTLRMRSVALYPCRTLPRLKRHWQQRI
jgi:hypothetical protein